ncbi:MAG: helix-turn-helix transcriptional regulator [Oscillospiraceae bacterium]|nr:helix-turn-helix transcriptional regulator [Oscillospiraceae bacterium]
MRIGNSLNLGVDIGMDYLPEMELPQLPALYRNALSALDSVFFRKNDQPVLYAGPLPVSDETLYASEYTEGFRQLLQSSPSDPDGLSALLIPPEKGTSFGKDAILRLYTRYFYLLSIHIPESDEIPQIRLLLDRFSTSLAAEIPLCELNSQLTELVNRVLEYSRKPVNYLVDRAQSFVRRNFSKAITLSSVASELCVSEEHLSRLFTETTGESFSHFLTSVRIDYAAELLRSGKYRIYEVSEMAGYSSTEHFSRVFKSRTGMTPRQYMNHTPQ